MGNYLALDFGASSGRGIVGSFDGKRFTLNEVHRFSNDPVICAGMMSWDVLRLFYEAKAALAASTALGQITSAAIDTWGVDYGYIDKNGMLMANPAHYRDSRTENMQSELERKLSREKLYSITGIMPQSINTIYQLLSDRLVRPWLPDRASKMLMMPDLFAYLLTGEIGCEYTIASTGGFLDARNREVSREVIDALGVPSTLFPKIQLAATKRSVLLPMLADECNIGAIPIVTAASHDTASAALAVPAIEDDFLFLSSGTWSIMGVESKNPVTSKEAYDGGFSNEGSAFGNITLIRNIMGLWLEQESRRQWKREGSAYSFDDLSRAAQTAAPCRSIVVPDDPAFSPAGDMPGRIADYCRRTGQPIPETPGEIVRCIFDSLALCYRHTAEKLEALCGKHYEKIYVVGGGTKETLLSKLTADCTGKIVTAGPTEATALGNIAIQALAAGEIADQTQLREILLAADDVKIYEPDRTARDMWDDAYERYLKLAN